MLDQNTPSASSGPSSASSIKTTQDFSAIIIINYVTNLIKHAWIQEFIKNVQLKCYISDCGCGFIFVSFPVFSNLKHFGNWIELGNKMTDHRNIWTSKTANSKINSTFYPACPGSSIFYDCLKPIDQNQGDLSAKVGLKMWKNTLIFCF